MPTIIGAAASRTFRVLWAMEELGLPYTHIPALPHSDDINAQNPSGKIPAFVTDDGTTLTDSTAILYHLADAHGGLAPKAGSTERARHDSVFFQILDELEGPLWTAGKNSFILPADKRVKAIKETCRWEFSEGIKRISERFEGPFVTGDSFTIADILLGHCMGWALLAKFELGENVLSKHLDDMRAREAYVRARQS